MTDTTDTRKMLQIPTMPDLWQMTTLRVSYKALARALAGAAAYMSPEGNPPANLAYAVCEFMHLWRRDYVDLCEGGSEWLYSAVASIAGACPSILAWDERRHGERSISTGALIRNICHDVALWEQVERAQDALSDKEAARVAE